MDLELRRTLDALPALVATLDRGLRYEFANAEHGRWFGIDSDKVVGCTLWDVVGPDLRTLLEPMAARALAGEAVDLEAELPASVRLRWARMTIRPEVAADGSVSRLHYLVTDLSRERALERQLERSETVFSAVFAAEGVGKALVDDAGIIRRVNRAFATMLGYVPADMVGLHVRDITHPDDYDVDIGQFEELKRRESDGYTMEKRYVAADGRTVDAFLAVSLVCGAPGAPDFFVAQIIDVRDRKAAEQRLRERNAQLALALEMLDGGVWHVDLPSSTVLFSPRLARSLAVAESGLGLEELLERVHPEDRPRLAIDDSASGLDEPATTTFRFRDARGDWAWLRWRRQLVRDDRGVPTTVLGPVMDVTEERRREAQLTQEAITDPLTGLLNRRGFDDALIKTMRPLRDTQPALLMIDLDRFKPINDAHGHLMGDRVLREMGRRLRATVRAGDMTARLGGDEFAVLLMNVDRPAAEAAAARIVAALGEPCRVGRLSVHTGASVGVAMASAWDDSCTLVKRADEALYAVKRAGRGAWKLAA